MSEELERLVKCGDTDICDQCELFEKNPELAHTVARHRTNMLGYCDYYEGPNKEIRVIQT